jgi:hypothetical protein
MDIIVAAQNVAEDYKGGARQLAIDIGKSPSTFDHQLHERAQSQLGLRTAVKMTRRTGDLRILNVFAAEAGCMVIPLPQSLAVDGNPAMQDLGQLAKEFSDVVKEVCATCNDDDVTANELQRVEREWGEVIVAGQKVLAALRAKHEADKAEASNLRAVK